jgi:hypothetical protein
MSNGLDPIVIDRSECEYVFLLYSSENLRCPSSDRGPLNDVARVQWCLYVRLPVLRRHPMTSNLTFISSWEFFTTLDYEWSIIRGRRPYRWTIWVRTHTSTGFRSRFQH